MIVVEAMKMEHVVRSSVEGTVSVHAAVGDTVSRGQTLAVITPPVDPAGTPSADGAADEPTD